MEGAPEGIEPSAVEEALHAVQGVLEVHDLHVWSLSVGKPSLSVHLLTREEAHGVLREATTMLGSKFNIHHSTIQVEREERPAEERNVELANVPGDVGMVGDAEVAHEQESRNRADHGGLRIHTPA